MKLEFDERNHSWASGGNIGNRSICQQLVRKKNRKMTISVLALGLAICACLISYIVFASESPYINNNSSLKLTSILFRHGSRLPTGSYNSDPHKNHTWDAPLGSLTNVGKQELYELGVRLRREYTNFLPENYYENDIYIQSSGLSRTLMSAYSLLAGLYPPTSRDMWNPNLLWQPIPVFSVPRELDKLIAVKFPCKVYDIHLAKAQVSPHMKKLYEKHKDLLFNLSVYCNQTIDTALTVEFLYNDLKAQRENGLTLPKWTDDFFPEQMKELSAESYRLFTHDTIMKRLISGPLLSEIITNMKLKDSGHLTPNRKMFLYSAHDITIVNMWSTLGFTEYLLPEYGASLTFELHSMVGNEDSEVKLLYSNSYSEKPKSLNIPACASPCTLAMFENVMKDVIPLDWETECNEV